MVDVSKTLLKTVLGQLKTLHKTLDGVIVEAEKKTRQGDKEAISGFKLKGIVILRDDNLNVIDKVKEALK